MVGFSLSSPSLSSFIVIVFLFLKKGLRFPKHRTDSCDGQEAWPVAELCSTPPPLRPLVLSPTLWQKWDLKSKVQSPFKCLHKTTCKSKVGSSIVLSLPPTPHPPPLFSVFLSMSTRRVVVLSFALHVVALHLTPLPAVVAGQRLPVFVHAPAVAPPPAFGWTALQRKRGGKKNECVACLLLGNTAQTCAAFNKRDWTVGTSRASTNITQLALTFSQGWRL